MKDNDEILQAIQELQPVGEYEKTITRSALKIAAIIGIICMLIMTLVEWLVVNKFDFGKPFLIALIAGLTDIIEWNKQKDKKSLRVFGILELLFAALCLFLYIVGLTGVS